MCMMLDFLNDSTVEKVHYGIITVKLPTKNNDERSFKDFLK